MNSCAVAFDDAFDWTNVQWTIEQWKLSLNFNFFKVYLIISDFAFLFMVNE